MDLFLKLRKTVCLAVAGLVACAGRLRQKRESLWIRGTASPINRCFTECAI